jgi:hypothetical protein
MTSHIKYYARHQIENNRLGEARDTYRRDMLVGKSKERRPLGRPRRMGRLILNWIIKIWDGEE